MFSVCLPTVIFMTYMVHKLKAVQDARKVKEEKENRQRKKVEMELAAEEAWLKEAKRGYTLNLILLNISLNTLRCAYLHPASSCN